MAAPLAPRPSFSDPSQFCEKLFETVSCDLFHEECRTVGKTQFHRRGFSKDEAKTDEALSKVVHRVYKRMFEGVGEAREPISQKDTFPIWDKIQQPEWKDFVGARADLIFTKLCEEKHLSLVELVKLKAALQPEVVAKNIEAYGIEDERDRIEIAKIVACSPEGYLGKFLSNFKITNPEALMELAILTAKHTPWLDNEALESFAIGRHPRLGELVTALMSKDQTPEVQQLTNKYLALCERNQQREIILRLARENPFELSNKGVPKGLGIDLEVAKILAKSNPLALTKFIRPGGLIGVPFKEGEEADHLELAEAIIAVDPPSGPLAENTRARYNPLSALASLKISEPERLKLAHKAVGRFVKWDKFSSLSYHIKTFGITDPKERAILAKKEAAHDPAGVAEFIENYDITDPDELVEIAKIIARTNPSPLGQHILKFTQDREKHFEIASLAAEYQPPFGSPINENLYEKFLIWDHPRVLELANKIIQCHQTSCFSKHSSKLSKTVVTKKDRVLLAAKCVFFHPVVRESVEQLEKDLGISDPNHLEIINVNWKLGSYLIRGHINHLGVVNEEAKRGYFAVMDAYCEKHISALAKECTQSLDPTDVRQVKELERRKCFLTQIALYLDTQEISYASLGRRAKETLSHLVTYPHYEVASRLADLLCNRVFPDGGKSAAFEKLAKKKFFRLPMIAVAAFGASKKDAASFDRLVGFGGTSPKLTNVETFIHALLTLASCPTLTDEGRVALIQKLSKAAIDGTSDYLAQYQKGLHLFSLAQVYLHVAPSTPLDDLPDEGLLEELERRVISELKKQNILDLEGIEDFGSKYGKTFQNLRVPGSLFIYAAQLPKEERLQEGINRYARAVLEGEEAWKRARYEDNRSLHCQTLADNFPELWRSWQEGGVSKLLEVKAEDQEVESVEFKAREFFQEKLEHNHDNGTFVQLRAYLKDPNEAALRSALEALSSGADGSDPHEAERRLLKLCSEEHPRDLQGRLMELSALLAPQLDTAQLAKDLKDAVAGFQKVGAGAFLADTDDWQDLLLAGTEVRGSCQVVNGTPDLNKCLLAYMLDGKNRMIALKDKDGSLIGRAIIRLLLDKDKKPALFLEQIYSNAPRYNAAITEYAKQRAAELHLPLFTHLGIASTELRSLGSPMPYEYVDALRNIMNDGVFTLSASPIL